MTFLLLYFIIEQILERLQKCDTTHGDLHGSASSDVCDGDRYLSRLWGVPSTSASLSFGAQHTCCVQQDWAMREPKGNKLLLLYMLSSPDMWWQIKAPWIFGTAMWRAFEICLKSITTWQNASLTQYAWMRLRYFKDGLRWIWPPFWFFRTTTPHATWQETLRSTARGKMREFWRLQSSKFTPWNHEIWGSTKLLPSFRRRMEGWQVPRMWECSSLNVALVALSLFHVCFVIFRVFSLKLEATKDLAARKKFCLLMGDGVGDTTMADGLDVETLKESRPKLQSSKARNLVS